MTGAGEYGDLTTKIKLPLQHTIKFVKRRNAFSGLERKFSAFWTVKQCRNVTLKSRLVSKNHCNINGSPRFRFAFSS